MGYLSTHWPKPPSRQDKFGYRVFGYGAAISAPIGRDSRGLSVENGILLPSLRPMLHLLDLHGVKRLDFHNSIMEVSRVGVAGPGWLDQLL
ncbi:Negative elongation factor B [Portunus trituberculatus]|uniref:Negative elongation factor B n=1 Tax=Portunus trituberculatus TaxID=210409 RepID=A0A5B7J4W2_PORTR|nr:Negative elongation factor B [Portunus trituberculatus]